MENTEVLSPDWFTSEKCQAITTKYFERLSNTLQIQLKSKIGDLGRKDDYVEFLRREGAVIWDEFIKDIANSLMKKRYTEEQIIGAIKEHEAGAKVDDICRSLGITLDQAQDLATQWLWQYNNERPNTAIGGVPPIRLMMAA